MAVDDPGHDPRVHSRDAPEQRGPVQEVPALSFQFRRLLPLHAREGVLPRGLRAVERGGRAGSLAPHGKRRRRGRLEHSSSGIALPARSLRRPFLPSGVRKDQHGFLSPRLFRLQLGSPDSGRSLWSDGVLDTEAHLGILRRHPFRCRGLGRDRRKRNRGRAEPGRLRQQDPRGPEPEPGLAGEDPEARRSDGGRGRIQVLRRRRSGRRARRRVRFVAREEPRGGRAAPRGERRIGPSLPRAFAGTDREAPALHGRASDDASRRRRVHLTGRDEALEPEERAACRRGAGLGPRRLAWRCPLPARKAHGGLDAVSLASPSRRHHGNQHAPCVPLLVERRDRQPERVRGRPVRRRGRRGARARHQGTRRGARGLQRAVHRPRGRGRGLRASAGRHREDRACFRPRGGRGSLPGSFHRRQRRAASVPRKGPADRLRRVRRSSLGGPVHAGDGSSRGSRRDERKLCGRRARRGFTRPRFVRGGTP